MNKTRSNTQTSQVSYLELDQTAVTRNIGTFKVHEYAIAVQFFHTGVLVTTVCSRVSIRCVTLTHAAVAHPGEQREN